MALPTFFQKLFDSYGSTPVVKRATADASGNAIASTYLSKAGGTMTGGIGFGGTATLTGDSNNALKFNGVDHTAFGMPKNGTGTTITVPSSGGSVTAQGDGYIRSYGSTSSGRIALANTTCELARRCFDSTGWVDCAIEVKKGDVVKFEYIGVTPSALFIPAAGTP